LIHDCYPKSKSATEPESNALGKLTFYTKSRPVKLAKVGRALSRRCEKHSETINGLCISLTILKKLLDECRSDVNVFGDDAMACINAGVRKAKSSTAATDAHSVMLLYEKAAGAFYALATFAQAESLDERLYFDILRQFCDLATDERTIQLRFIGLHALEGVVQSEYFHACNFRDQNTIVVEAVMKDLAEGRLDSNRSDPDTSKAESKKREETVTARPSLHDRRARSIRIAKGLEGTEKPPSSTDAAKEAHKVLLALLRLAQPRHVEATLAEALSFLNKHDSGKYWSKQAWCTWLAGEIMEGTPTQYRFIVVNSFLAELRFSQDMPVKKTTLLQILVQLLSSPNIAVVNLALGDILETLSGLVFRNPRDQEYPKAILALASHTYYPAQINDFVADLLDDCVQLRKSGQPHADAIVALLHCARQLVDIVRQADSSKGKGMRHDLSTERLANSLYLLGSDDEAVRPAYLQTIAAITSAIVAMETENARPETARTIPSITFSNSTRGGIPLHPSQNARFFRQLQIQLYGVIETHDIASEELRSLDDLLQALYATKEGQVVLEGVPVLMAWKAAAGASGTKQGLIAELLSSASRVLAAAWGVALIPDAEAFIDSLASSSELQSATSLSQSEIATRLSQPYSQSSMSPTETLASPARRAQSVRSSRYANTVNGGSTSLRNVNTSVLSTSLADLKASLNQHHSHGGTPTSNSNSVRGTKDGQHSPGRSTLENRARSIASSGRGHEGTATPPQLPNGTQRRQSPSSSTRDSFSLAGSPQSRKRLDRIVGSMDDNQSNRNGVLSTIPSPPYQLS